MNILKNMEAWFALSFGVACAFAYLHDGTPAAAGPAQQHASGTISAAPGPMPVVVITAKRLTAEQKRAAAN